MSDTTKKGQTAAERRKLAAVERAQRVQLAQAEFEAKRTEHWQTLWVKALRLTALLSGNEEYYRQFRTNSWWGGYFGVDAIAQSFSVNEKQAPINEASINFADFPEVNSRLDNGIENILEFYAQQERERLAEVERQRVRKQAIAKLTDEELQALHLERTR